MLEVSVRTFAAARADGAVTIDVREPEEFEAGHVPGAVLVPLGELSARLRDLPRRGRVFVVCATGNRSLVAARELVRQGVAALSVAGGTAAWEAAGLPVVRGARSDVA